MLVPEKVLALGKALVPEKALGLEMALGHRHMPGEMLLPVIQLI